METKKDDFSDKDTEPRKADENIRFSEFSSVHSKCPRTVTLEHFVGRIRSEEFKNHTGRYRALLAQPGQEAEARKVKNATPAISPAAICFGGHSAGNISEYSKTVCIDLDHTNLRTDEIKQLASQLPYVLATFISISGEGVKVLVRIREEDLADGYLPLYLAVGEAISAHVSHDYDTQCKAPTQLCYYSHDTAAYYNPHAAPFVPTDETKEKARIQARNATNNIQPVQSSSMDATKAISSSHSTTPTGDNTRIIRFLRLFSSRNPFVRGSRNETCLKLGRELRCNFFSQEETTRATILYAGRYAESDFTEKDISQRISSGYQFIRQSEGNNPEKDGDRQGSRFTLSPQTPAMQEEDKEEVSDFNNVLRAQMPCLPEEIYARLPKFMQQCVRHTTHPRERDITLLSSLVACSALFHGVSFFYKDRFYSPHLYFAIVAPAGTGKGTMGLVANLLDRTDAHYARLRNEQKKKYEADSHAWDEEVRCARQEKRKADINRKPDMPHPQYFKISPNTSRSRLIESLAAAGETGCIMVSTEIGTLSTAIGQDYGAFEDVLLKAAHHEQVDSSFRIDGEPIIAPKPHLALLLSGTQEQFAEFFRYLNSGLFSRWGFYTRGKENNFECCAPGEQSIDLRSYFCNLGEELLEMHLGLQQSPTCVTFSDAQWQEHTRLFSGLTQQANAEGRDAASGIIFRCGLQVMRIAATLTVFRKWEDYRWAKEYCCTDDDFHTALQIGETILQHSLLLSTSLPDSKSQPARMHRFFRLQSLLNALPEKTFTYTNFVNKAAELDIPHSTAKRLLKKAVEHHFINKEEDKYIKRDSESV